MLQSFIEHLLTMQTALHKHGCYGFSIPYFIQLSKSIDLKEADQSR
jgi:hypothetical protein